MDLQTTSSRRWPIWIVPHGLQEFIFSHFPKVSKLDLRLEGVYTDFRLEWALTQQPASFFKRNLRNGYTNDGNL